MPVLEEAVIPEYSPGNSDTAVHDIEDPNHLCLEDMRLKEGEEKTNKLMEDKMLRIQKDISNLKRDFKKIQQRNENLHREYQVPKEKFQMTDFTYKLIQEEIEAKMKEVVKSRGCGLSRLQADLRNRGSSTVEVDPDFTC